MLAGIVMSLDGDKMEDLRIVSVSTGTKCVNGEHMSVNGNSLNGEILVLKQICKYALEKNHIMNWKIMNLHKSLI